jgi:voltage-gated potassium channel
MDTVNHSSRRGWVADYKYTFLLVAVLVLVLAPLAVGAAEQRSLILRACSFGVILFGILAVLQHRKTRTIAVTLAVLASVAHGGSFVYGTQFYPQLRLALSAALFSFMAVIIARDVMRAEVITWDKIQGAVCAYLLFGVAWGVLYGWVGLGDPQAFSGAVGGGGDSGEPMVYFSFVTLTTLGYGDITPVSQTARTLSWLEAAFGQIYLVVLVAHLISRQLTHSRGDKP